MSYLTEWPPSAEALVEDLAARGLVYDDEAGEWVEVEGDESDQS